MTVTNNSPLVVKLCFVMDCTASMEPWIQQAKTKIVDVTNRIQSENPSAEVVVAFVGYRDYGDEERSIVLPFQDPRSVMREIRGVFAEGGDDQAEDVAHAMMEAHHLEWTGADLKFVFHIADAPAHGLGFHSPAISDRFPRGDPDGLDPRDFVERMSFLDINFTFVKINNSTDTMIEQFHNCYGHGGVLSVIDLRPQHYDRTLGDPQEHVSELFSNAVSREVTLSIHRHTASQEQ
jgi:hypothetical protein